MKIKIDMNYESSKQVDSFFKQAFSELTKCVGGIETHLNTLYYAILDKNDNLIKLNGKEFRLACIDMESTLKDIISSMDIPTGDPIEETNVVQLELPLDNTTT